MLREITEGQPVDIEPIMQARESKRDMSPIEFLAQFMLKEAHEEQKKLAQHFEGNSTVTHRPTREEVYNGLSHHDRNLFLISQGGIIFASLLPELEATLIEGEFSTKGFFDRYNSATMRTLLPQWRTPESHIETIQPDSMQRMFRRVREDKTFSSFFDKKGVLDLPQTARGKLEETELLETIVTLIIPSYYEAAKGLIISR